LKIIKTMKKPKVIILAGYGLNCEEETKFGFQLAGAEADIVHINDCIDNPQIVKQYHILAIPGGFSYGDDTGAGNAFANKLKNHLWEEILTFTAADKLTVAICNGFQIIVHTGLLTGLTTPRGTKDIALLQNESSRLIDRWTDVKNFSSSPWLRGITELSLPISHGEGRLYTEPKTLRLLKKFNMIALRYVKGKICNYLQIPANPTGTMDDIAGITDKTGRILGLMPHPERALFFTQLPHWTHLKEVYTRHALSIPKEGPGLQLFKNAVSYFTS
jgi:phosphoribosylformylglycinamidine (FGAM) synthase-like amidotransferase family enzyme